MKFAILTGFKLELGCIAGEGFAAGIVRAAGTLASKIVRCVGVMFCMSDSKCSSSSPMGACVCNTPPATVTGRRAVSWRRPLGIGEVGLFPAPGWLAIICAAFRTLSSQAMVVHGRNLG